SLSICQTPFLFLFPARVRACLKIHSRNLHAPDVHYSPKTTATFPQFPFAISWYASPAFSMGNSCVIRSSGWKEPSDHEIQVFSIGCHNYMPLFLLPDILRKMRETHPNLHPRLLTVPFQHLYRLLEDEDVDVILGFADPRRSHGTYRELAKV